MRFQTSGERAILHDMTWHDAKTDRKDEADELSGVSIIEHPPLQSHPHKANATLTRRKHSKRLTGTNRAVGGSTRYHVNTANSRRDLLIPKNCLSFCRQRDPRHLGTQPRLA